MKASQLIKRLQKLTQEKDYEVCIDDDPVKQVDLTIWTNEERKEIGSNLRDRLYLH